MTALYWPTTHRRSADIRTPLPWTQLASLRVHVIPDGSGELTSSVGLALVECSALRRALRIAVARKLSLAVRQLYAIAVIPRVAIPPGKRRPFSASRYQLQGVRLSAGTRLDVLTVNTFRVFLGRFAYFRVVNSDVSAGQAVFCSGFDSRQLHQRLRRSPWNFGIAAAKVTWPARRLRVHRPV
jgi:hypothetical protein